MEAGNGRLGHHERPTLLRGHEARADVDERLLIERSSPIIAAVQGQIAARRTGAVAGPTGPDDTGPSAESV